MEIEKRRTSDVNNGVNSEVSSAVNIVNNDCEGDDSLLNIDYLFYLQNIPQLHQTKKWNPLKFQHQILLIL